MLVLHDVVGDVAAAIACWRAPRHACLRVARNANHAARRSWFGCDIHGCVGAKVDGNKRDHVAADATNIDSVAGTPAAIVATAPTFECCVIEQRTCVFGASTNCKCGAAGAEVDCGEVGAHLIWKVSEIILITNTQSSRSAIAEALHLSRSENNTRVCLAGRHGHRRTTTTKADRRELCAHLVCSVANVACSPATEAPVTSSPPTLERAIIQDCAHMIVARTECACSEARAKVDCRKRSWRRAIGGVAKAKLAAGVGAPTRDGKVVE